LRKPIIAGNWKMNMLVPEALELTSSLTSKLGETPAEVVLCPPFTALATVGEHLQDSPIMLGGQNCYCEEKGAFTGEISPQMLMNVGCEWVIVGHSERRGHFGETDDLLNRKLHFALNSGLRVMFCIGETLEERESNKTQDVLKRQVIEGLKGLAEKEFGGLVVAYEPVWAIGTGKTATPDQAQEAPDLLAALPDLVDALVEVTVDASSGLQGLAQLLVGNSTQRVLDRLPWLPAVGHGCP